MNLVQQDKKKKKDSEDIKFLQIYKQIFNDITIEEIFKLACCSSKVADYFQNIKHDNKIVFQWVFKYFFTLILTDQNNENYKALKKEMIEKIISLSKDKPEDDCIKQPYHLIVRLLYIAIQFYVFMLGTFYSISLLGVDAELNDFKKDKDLNKLTKTKNECDINLYLDDSIAYVERKYLKKRFPNYSPYRVYIRILLKLCSCFFCESVCSDLKKALNKPDKDINITVLEQLCDSIETYSSKLIGAHCINNDNKDQDDEDNNNNPEVSDDEDDESEDEKEEKEDDEESDNKSKGSEDKSNEEDENEEDKKDIKTKQNDNSNIDEDKNKDKSTKEIENKKKFKIKEMSSISNEELSKAVENFLLLDLQKVVIECSLDFSDKKKKIKDGLSDSEDDDDEESEDDNDI